MEMPLMFIVLACHMNASDPNEQTPICKEFKEELLDEGANFTSMSCMMVSPVMVVKFEEQHPGWQVKKWSCKYVAPEQEI